jgi:anti-anti-sigma regulatory factor
MTIGRLALTGALGFEARGEFIAKARSIIASADTSVELDCSAVESVGPLDDAVIGMLVTLARTAQRRGARVVLVRAPKPMRAQLEAAGVGHFFNFQR